MVQVVIIWANGTFGTGKTTTSHLVADKSPELRMFDPESVGYMLRPNLTDYPVRDFRDWESWRFLTPIVADEVVRFSGQSLVAPQAVLEEVYSDELLRGLSQRGHDLLHVLLDADEGTLRARIQADTELAVARQGRVEHLPRYVEALGWMSRRADLVVDTTEFTPEGHSSEAADLVWDAAQDRLA